MSQALKQQQALQTYLLRLADSNLILSQRLCELCGKAPAVEEELALMNVALDLVGQARNWYEYAGELDEEKRDADALAFRRDAHQYHSFLLTEQPNGDYAVTMARQFFYDTWHYFTLQALVNSADERIAGIAEKAIKEVPITVAHQRLKRGDGTDEAISMEVAEENWRLQATYHSDEVDSLANKFSTWSHTTGRRLEQLG